MKIFATIIAALTLAFTANAGSFTPIYMGVGGEFLTNATFTAAALTTNAIGTTNANILILQQGTGFAFSPSLVGTNTASVSNIVFNFEFRVKGNTNWTTTHPLTYTLASKGTNTVRGFTNFTAAQVANVEAVKLGSIENLSVTNAISVTETSYDWFGQYLLP